MQFKDYYEVLGVPSGAAADVIKSAYRRLARKYHPDVSKEADAARHMAAVNEANEVLSDPEKRSAYDAVGHQAWAQGARSADDEDTLARQQPAGARVGAEGQRPAQTQKRNQAKNAQPAETQVLAPNYGFDREPWA